MPSIQTSGSQQRATSQQRSGSQTRVMPQLMNQYKDLLAKNTANYNTFISAHQTAVQNQQQQLQSAYGSFDQTQASINQSLRGQGTAEAEILRRQAAQAQGQTQQQMINSGLGNSSILGALSQQNALNYNLASNDLSERIGRQAAGYTKDIGLAKGGAMMQGAGLSTNLEGQYLGDLAGYRFGNTFGNITGSFGQSSGGSQSTGSSQSLGLSVESPMRGGGGGGGMGPVPGLMDPHNPGVGSGIAGLGYGDVSTGQQNGLTSYGGGGNMTYGGGSPAVGGGLDVGQYSSSPASQPYSIWNNNATRNAG